MKVACWHKSILDVLLDIIITASTHTQQFFKFFFFLPEIVFGALVSEQVSVYNIVF